ncbi:MAG: hypothetical protein U5L45_01570 [Saprospiraceae bacterium]|nr:hypothetical protein [Saprospiraceae bacterium]
MILKIIKKAEKMEASRAFLDTHRPFFGKAMDEVRQEGIEEGRRNART